MAKQRHKDLVNACLTVLRLRRAYVWENRTGARTIERKDGSKHFMRFGKVGSADIIGVLEGGYFCAVECKVGRDVVRPEQQAFLAAVRLAGGFTCVAHSVEDLDASLDEYLEANA